MMVTKGISALYRPISAAMVDSGAQWCTVVHSSAHGAQWYTMVHKGAQ